jgi:fructokinase
MRKVLCIGEAVYDIIFKNEQPVEARPGGAMLNTAISLGRLNVPVSFSGDFANDHVGRIILNYLRNNNVNTRYVSMYENARSRIALAFLDKQNNADYAFYKLRTDQALVLNVPEIKQDDIVIFGSYFGIKPEIREQLKAFLEKARSNKAILIYDPNFRPAHLHLLRTVRPFIEENIALSNIVKGSDEDFMNIYGTADSSETYKLLEPIGCKNFIYTANAKGVDLRSGELSKHYPANELVPVSTVGAGDSFNAGLVFALLENNILHADIDNIQPEIWDKIIATSIDFASHVCMIYDNYITEEFAKNYINKE